MRWSSILLPLSMLSTGILAARQSSEQRFNDFHKKALATAPVKLNDVSYKKLTKAPRDYTVAVLLTAMDPRYGCQLCREFQPEWDLLSKSWTKGDKAGKGRMLFTTLDFSDGRDVFMSLGLQTAPVLMLFQPTLGQFAVPNAEPVRYDFTSGAQMAEQIHDWIAKHMADRPQPEIKRPTNWLGIFLWVTSISGVITFVSVAWPYLIPIVTNRKLWAAGCVVWILTFTSGYMFNRIRNTPYVAGDGKGGISYFAGGFQSQYGLESQIVGALYGILALSAIALADRVPRMPGPRGQSIALLAWSAVCIIFYSFLLSIFRIKNGGYPFSLPPFL